MKRNLLIKVLTVLEKEAPLAISTQNISNKIGIRFEPQGELLQIVNYLIESKRVVSHYTNHLPVLMNGSEKLHILPDGIDLLTDLKSIHQKERSEQQQYNLSLSVSTATVVLALAAFIDAAMSIVLNSNPLRTALGGFWFVCLIALFFIIFCFMAFLVFKSYYVIQNKGEEMQ